MSEKLIKLKYYRALADTYWSLQKIRIASSNRIFAMLEKMDEVEEVRESVLNKIVDDLIEMEKSIYKEAKEILNEPVYIEFLSKIKGLGFILSLKLLSLGWDLKRNLSSWNAYAGLVPFVYKCKCEEGHRLLLPRDPVINPSKCYCIVDRKVNPKTKQVTFIRCGARIVKGEIAPGRRHQGYAFFWNPKVKTTLWLIATSFTKTGKFYKNFYNKWKDKYKQDGLKDGHAIARAKRKTAKLFLAHFYQAWHEIEGLDYRMPYQFEYLKHNSFINWKDVVDFDKN